MPAGIGMVLTSEVFAARYDMVVLGKYYASDPLSRSIGKNGSLTGKVLRFAEFWRDGSKVKKNIKRASAALEPALTGCAMRPPKEIEPLVPHHPFHTSLHKIWSAR